jgi:hypothetical protein
VLHNPGLLVLTEYLVGVLVLVVLVVQELPQLLVLAWLLVPLHKEGMAVKEMVLE